MDKVPKYFRHKRVIDLLYFAFAVMVSAISIPTAIPWLNLRNSIP